MADMRLASTWVMRSHCRNRHPHAKQETAKDRYCQSQKALSKFDTVKGLWQALNNVPFPSPVLGVGKMNVEGLASSVSAISIFRDSNQPVWEHYDLNDGIIEFKLTHVSLHVVNHLWLSIVLSTIGRQDIIDSGVDDQVIVGMRLVNKSVSRKICVKFEMWTCKAREVDINNLKSWIRIQMAPLLTINTPIEYTSHSSQFC